MSAVPVRPGRAGGAAAPDPLVDVPLPVSDAGGTVVPTTADPDPLVTVSELSDGCARTARVEGSPGTTATASTPSETSAPTLKVKLEPSRVAVAVRLQS